MTTNSDPQRNKKSKGLMMRRSDFDRAFSQKKRCKSRDNKSERLILDCDVYLFVCLINSDFTLKIESHSWILLLLLTLSSQWAQYPGFHLLRLRATGGPSVLRSRLAHGKWWIPTWT